MVTFKVPTLLNKSAETGIIPADWKSANVNGIHKKIKRQEPENYRPIRNYSQYSQPTTP